MKSVFTCMQRKSTCNIWSPPESHFLTNKCTLKLGYIVNWGHRFHLQPQIWPWRPFSRLNGNIFAIIKVAQNQRSLSETPTQARGWPIPILLIHDMIPHFLFDSKVDEICCRLIFLTVPSDSAWWNTMNEFISWLTLVVPFTVTHAITFTFKPSIPASVSDQTITKLPLIT